MYSLFEWKISISSVGVDSSKTCLEVTIIILEPIFPITTPEPEPYEVLISTSELEKNNSFPERPVGVKFANKGFNF